MSTSKENIKVKFTLLNKISIAFIIIAFIPILSDIISNEGLELALIHTIRMKEASRIPLRISAGLFLIIVVLLIYIIVVPKISGGPNIQPSEMTTKNTTETK